MDEINPKRRRGRPVDHGTSKQYWSRLPHKVGEALEQACETHHLSISEIIRDAVIRYLAKLAKETPSV